MALPPAAKKRRSEDVGGEGKREALVTNLQKLTDAINKTVEETRSGFEAARSRDGQDFEEFLMTKSSSGLRNLWRHVASYAECMQKNDVSRYSDLERCWESEYGAQKVRDAVEGLLEAEERHEDLLKDIESVFINFQSSGAPLVKKTVGDEFCGAFKVTDARSGEIREIQSYCDGSKFTLFVLIRHFG